MGEEALEVIGGNDSGCGATKRRQAGSTSSGRRDCLVTMNGILD
jgi:hypothetical protein